MDTQEDFLVISRELAMHHSIFSKLWQIGRPRLTEDIPTAAVCFNRKGGFIEFVFNPTFLSKLSMDEICFVCAHECLHVILNHGKRMKGLHPKAFNIAADIVINEMLINNFNFSADLPLIKDMPACLISTVFNDKDISKIERNREFEYYYNLLMKDAIEIKIGGGQSFDNHEGLPEELLDDIEHMIDKMSKQELQTLERVLGKDVPKDGKDKPLNSKTGEDKANGAGKESIFDWIKTALKPKPIKRWEEVIKSWAVKAFMDKNKQQWRHTNRRFAIVEKSSNLIIPSNKECIDKNNKRIDVAFFMDVSGSCYSHSVNFFQSAKTIPLDKFDVKAFAFNTEVIEIDIKKNEMPNGGGTAFHQIEEHLMTFKKYPSAVFVLTDGEGTQVNPKYPDRWHIFLTSDYRNCFPKEVNFHKYEEVNVNKG